MSQTSDTYLEAIPREQVAQPAPPRRHVLKRAVLWILGLVALGWIAATGISFAIQHSRLSRALTARIETSFGRPVEVGSYDFSFWGGPTLEAQSVTIAEDPRFGPEYFLRAESMAVGLRWQSLLRGRIDLGTLSLVRPSLNLVRNADGEWNLAEWLPRPAGAGNADAPVGPSLPSSALRFSRIEVQEGRVNFKRGDDKLPFALTGVTGTVETNGSGRWRMDLDAAPWRAAIVLQQMGVIHVSGDVGGTSSRLRPAALNVTWTEASIPDVLRLALGGDSGVRGDLALALSARTRDQDDAWDIQGRVQLSQIHRWDLALRPDNPSVNLLGRMEWQPADSSLELENMALEAPHSNARGSGRILWNSGGAAARKKSPDVQFALAGSQVDAGDALAWVRAFRPGVADDVSARGTASIQAEASGWPLGLVDATVTSSGADFFRYGARGPAHLGEIQLTYDRGAIAFHPIALSWGGVGAAPAGSFRIDLATTASRKPVSTWHIAGSTSQVRSVIAGAGALGLNISRGWDLAGGFACDLRWQTPADRLPPADLRQAIGWMEFGGSGAGVGDAVLRAPFLNLPVEQIKARAEWKPGAQHVALASAQAFGTRWSGAFDRRDTAGDWQFSLSADRLAAAQLDRWLNPLWRESFLGRMLPFLNSRSTGNAVPEDLRAAGHLSVGQFTLEPFDVRHLDADLKMEGRHIALAKASGQFYGGTIGGSLDADLGSAPSYDANLDFSRLDLAAISAESPALAGLFAGSASGSISFQARGATRSDLLQSLSCQGSAQIANPRLLSVDLGESLRDGIFRSGSDQFATASAGFSCAQRTIQFETLEFVRADEAVRGSGAVDFGRNLDLRLQLTPAQEGRPAPAYRLTGTLAAPQLASTAATARRPR